ncbi:MAG: limonene-1,2-epoxide hydrolase family protein [Acidimicrobiales bacterium]
MKPDEIVARFITAIESHELDRVLDMMSLDAEYDNVPMSKAVGHDAIRSVLAVFLSDAGSTVEFKVLRQATTGNLVMNERLDRLEINGKIVEIAVAGIFEVDPATGKITLWRDYFDMAQFSAQLA